ncbi:MAG TPA: arginine--tRNA ligase, partial [Nitrospiria bacterium]|nr:arginine--tRNA ligase [Nitrospiria bacterium]
MSYSSSKNTYAFEAAKNEAASVIQQHLGEIDGLRFELPPPGIDADLAIPCFPLAKVLRKNPSAIATELAAILVWPDDGLIERAEGLSGYLNLYYRTDQFVRRVLLEVSEMEGEYGKGVQGIGQTVVIDFSSPNIAKPMSVGHLRSTLIGDALYRIYRFLGYHCVGINHLGDWGTQFGKLIVSYERWGNEDALSREPIRELLRLYVEFHERAAKEPDLEEEGRNAFRRLETGDPEACKLWEHFRSLSLQEFERIYQLLGVHFDHWTGESAYNKDSGPLISEALEKEVAVESEGALIIPLEDQGIETPLVLRKRDGTSLYSTRDLAAARLRIDRYRPTLMIYVVGAEQKLHFQQLFAALRKLGYAGVRLQHVDFGLMSLPEGKMSTRAGRVIFLEEVIREAVDRAK